MKFVTIYHAPKELTYEDTQYAASMASDAVIAIVDDTATNVYGTRKDAMAVVVALGLDVEEIAG